MSDINILKELQLKDVTLQCKYPGFETSSDIGLIEKSLEAEIRLHLKPLVLKQFIDSLLADKDLSFADPICLDKDKPSKFRDAFLDVVAPCLSGHSPCLILINPRDWYQLTTLKDSQGSYANLFAFPQTYFRFICFPTMPAGNFVAFNSAFGLLAAYQPYLTLTCSHEGFFIDTPYLFETNWKIGVIIDNPPAVKAGKLVFSVD